MINKAQLLCNTDKSKFLTKNFISFKSHGELAIEPRPEPEPLQKFFPDTFTRTFPIGIKQVFERQMQEFPKDIEYRKTILTNMGLNPQDSWKLRPVTGAQELNSIVKSLKPENYSPGKLGYISTSNTIRSNFKVVSSDKRNVKNYKFAANLHLHTKNSDGQLTVQQVLDQAAEYADKRAERTGASVPFVVAITDHDTVNGDKQAIEIIAQNPEKYRNLRVVLGIENSTLFRDSGQLKDPDNNPDETHMLAYCVNPYEEAWQGLLGAKIDESVQTKKRVIQNANAKFSKVLGENKLTYDFEEAQKIAPSLGTSICDARGYMKDYLQLRLVFAHMVENNKPLVRFMQNHGVRVSELDFVKPRDDMAKNLGVENVAQLDYRNHSYWGHYYNSLKKYIKDTLTAGKPPEDKRNLESGLDSRFKSFDPEVLKVLSEIERGCFETGSPLHPIRPELNEFTHAVSTIAGMGHGVMGIAHPELIYPEDCLKEGASKEQFIRDLFACFRQNGGNRAIFSENNYQAGGKKPDPDFLKAIKNASSEAGLLSTGSLDTHGKSISDV